MEKNKKKKVFFWSVKRGNFFSEIWCESFNPVFGKKRKKRKKIKTQIFFLKKKKKKI